MVADFRKKQKKYGVNSLFIGLGGLLIFLGIGVLIFANINVYQQKEKFNAQISNLKERIDDLQSQNNSLKENISSQDDSQYIEKVAREQLGLQKQGEKVVSFVAKEETKPAEQPSENKNFWQAWTGWLAGGWEWLKAKF